MKLNREIATELRGASKRLGGRIVLEGLDLSVATGAVTALLGANGVVRRRRAAS